MVFFGGGFGGGFGGRGSGPRRGNDISFALGVTLKDMYNGAKKKLKVNKDVLCGTCDGKGSEKDGATKTCPRCRGQGVVFTRRQMGPSIIQMQQDCDECNRKGEIIDPKDRCKQCKGKKVVKSPRSSRWRSIESCKRANASLSLARVIKPLASHPETLWWSSRRRMIPALRSTAVATTSFWKRISPCWRRSLATSLPSSIWTIVCS